jgi:hypothetical protein
VPNIETGVDRGVLYIPGFPGEPWNGLTSIQEDSTDVNEKTRYVDGVKTHHRRGQGSFSGTISAFTYPDSFYENVLVQKRRPTFDLSYRVMNGDSYKIHLVYNVSISPGGISRKQFETEPFQWSFTTTPIAMPNSKISSHLIVDASKAYPSTIEHLENILYGSDIETSHLPSPDGVFNIFELNSIVRVIDNGDGSFSVTGPDDIVQMLDATTFQISWPSAVYIDTNTYTISSL